MSEDEEPVDGYECRTQFKELLGTLSSSQQIVQRVSDFAIKPSVRSHASMMYDILREKMAATPTLNRLHFLYVLDAICQKSARLKLRVFTDLVAKDLAHILRLIVPDDNPVNASQVQKVRVLFIRRNPHTLSLVNTALKYVVRWKAKNLFREADLVSVEERINALVLKAPAVMPEKTYTKAEILRRIEEDRDRHKKHREEGWHRPDPSQDADSSKKRRTSMRRDEFLEAWDKIDGLTETGDAREWTAMSSDLARFDAEHPGLE
ncbi:hypothetical protein BC830DRAFT_289143 [Chytriomyces sp. MP71]|nr:hypothetical protein BC830DRAFT_289143 [Chytriomyces sp. MP71]